MSGFALSWSSTPGSVAQIDAAGVATAMQSGTAQIRASTEGLVGRATLTVVLVPASAESVAGDGQTGIIGVPLTEPIEVRILDAGGGPIRGERVTFAVQEGGGSVFPFNPLTDLDGVASTQWTLGPNPALPQKVTATLGGVSVELSATAEWPPLVVANERPPNARLTLDYDLNLEASGGPGAPYQWTLLEGGLPPGLSIGLSGHLTGTPTAEGVFEFSAQVQDSEGMTAVGEFSFEVCPAPTFIALGEALVRDPSGLEGCGFFIPTGVAGDRYRVGIVRSETNQDSEDVVTATLEARGLGVENVPIPQPAGAAPSAPLPSALAASLMEAEAIAEATEALHLSIWDEERALLPTLTDARPLPSYPANSAAVAAAQAAAAPARRLLKFYNYEGCKDVAPKPAILLGQNDFVAVYQDSAQMASEPASVTAVQGLLDFYRDYGNTVINSYFGGVSDVNGDGLILVYITPGIRESAAAFVRGFDMLPQEACPSSNAMEITYTKPSFVNRYDDGGYQLVGTMVHEIKHISSLYNRLVAGRYHPSWVEEGTAEIAKDRASRLAISQNGGPDVGAMLTDDDIVQWGRTEVGWGTLYRLNRSLRYIASQPNSVTVNPAGAQWIGSQGPVSSHTIYGAGWHFHRWLGDAYGNAATAFADSALFRLQNDSLTTAGPEGYPTLVGKTFPELMEEYAVAVMLNGTGAPPPARPFTSFDFPSAMSTSLVYSAATRPPGLYPWPVTLDDDGPGSVSMETATYEGPMGESGLRVHDFVSNGTGQGAEIAVGSLPAGARMILVRIR